LIDQLLALEPVSPDLRGVSKTAAMISAVVAAIPMVGHAKGTARQTVQRPMAYLYARRDGLEPEDRRLVVNICERVTKCGGSDLAYLSVSWLRLNGEAAAGGRSAWRNRPSKHSWWISLSSRSVRDGWAGAFIHARTQLGYLSNTLPGHLLALTWSPELAVLYRWRREGVSVGDDMRVRADLAESRNELEPDLQERVHLLAAMPVTSALSLALVDVPRLP
jgi:hypothetical protein